METYTYEVLVSDSGYESIKRTDADGNISIIPTDLGNSDYYAYAVAEGIIEVVEPEVVEPEPVTPPAP
jgi:hypothetical protein